MRAIEPGRCGECWDKVPFELHLFAHDGHGTSTCTQEVNTPNRHNSAWVPLCTDWLADTLDFHL